MTRDVIAAAAANMTLYSRWCLHGDTAIC